MCNMTTIIYIYIHIYIAVISIKIEVNTKSSHHKGKKTHFKNIYMR